MPARGRPRLYDDVADEVVSLRLTKDMSRRLRFNAERRGLSISKYTRYCIEKVLDEEDNMQDAAYVER